MEEKIKLIEITYRKQNWVRYQEIEPMAFEIKCHAFKLIKFTFSDKSSFIYKLTKIQYNKWRKILDKK